MYTRHFKTLLCGFLLALCGMFPGRPAQATSINDEVSTITYNDGVRKIYTFATGTDGNLYTNYWNGAWHWANMGKPGVDLASVSAITFSRNGLQQIYVFAAGTDSNLYVNYWNGASWSWLSLGHPAADMVGNPIAMTYFDGTAQQIRVVCSGNFTGLYLLSMQGNSASWRSLGNGGTSSPVAQTAVTYMYGGIPYFDVFASEDVTSADIFRDAWHGNTGSAWKDQGHPSGLGGITQMSAVTYPAAVGAPYLYDFTVSQDTNDLYVNYGRGTTWHWADQSNPGTKVYSPSALVIGSNIYAFCAGWDGNLYVNYWNGAWHWANQGHPSTTVSVSPSPSSSIAYNDGVQRIYVFGVGANGDLCVNYWNGAWHWADQGHP